MKANKYLLVALILSVFISCSESKTNRDTVENSKTFGLVIHGGAGSMEKDNYTEEQILEYESVLNQALSEGYSSLEKNETALDAIEKVIAILDAGFPGVDIVSPFQRLRDNNQILGGYNFVDRSNNFYAMNSHGTQVLSTMGGFADNQLVGTAPDASYYLFVTEDTTSETPLEESLWVEAAEMADKFGADVINSSLGYFDFDNPNYSYTYNNMNGTTAFCSRGANIAFTRGMVVVVSAGNSGNTSNPHISAPADATNAFTVGAVNSLRNYASFSSIGPSFDGRIKPDVMAQGQSAVVAMPSGVVATNSGTSFSGPIIAGMVASFWQAFPNLTNSRVVQLIKESSDHFTNPNEQYGYGIPNFQLALSNALANNQFSTEGFFVYPNPFSEEVTFSFPSNAIPREISIFNNLGQMVINKSNLNQIQNIYIKTAKILFWKRYTLTIINKDKIVFQYPFSAKKRNHIKKEVFNIKAAIRFT